MKMILPWLGTVKSDCVDLEMGGSLPITSACNSNEALPMKLMKAKLVRLKAFAVKKLNEFDAYIDRGIASWQAEYSLAMAAY